MRVLLACLSLACLVAASPLRVEKLVAGRDVIVTPQDIDNFKFFAQWAGSSYCNSDASRGDRVNCSSNACPAVMANNATVWMSLNGDTPTGMEGFVGLDPARSLIVVSLRGSHSIRNFLADFVFPQISCPLTQGCLVHVGFWASWLQIRAAVITAVASAAARHPDFAVVVTGHSLGGAVGHLAASALRTMGVDCDLYTYGSPRVGNLVLTRFLGSQAGAEYRVTHAADPVPRLPPLIFNYRHTSPEYWVYGADVNAIRVCEGSASVGCNAGSRGFDIDAHSDYFGGIGACAPGGSPPLRRAARDLSESQIADKVDELAVLDWAFAAELEKEGDSSDKSEN